MNFYTSGCVVIQNGKMTSIFISLVSSTWKPVLAFQLFVSKEGNDSLRKF